MCNFSISLGNSKKRIATNYFGCVAGCVAVGYVPEPIRLLYWYIMATKLGFFTVKQFWRLRVTLAEPPTSSSRRISGKPAVRTVTAPIGYSTILLSFQSLFQTFRSSNVESCNRYCSNVEHYAYLPYKLSMKRAGSQCAPSL